MDTAPTEPNMSDTTRKADLVKKLYQDIETAVKERDFSHAEALRNKLMEIDPTALSEIIRSADLIEAGKTAGIDKDHLAIWDDLYSTLTPEEKNCLFYSLKRIVVPPKRIILSHGAYNTRLFFIDSGKVTIIFPKKGKNTVLAQLGAGKLLGEYSFTTISLCSATAVSYSEVVLYCLENAATDKWNDEHPGLYEKVTDFCMKNGSLEEISKWKTLEKRNKPRYPASGPVKGYLLNKEGKKTDTYFKGSLSDISQEGCSFEIKLSKKETARALLARHLLLTFSFDIDGQTFSFESVGKIVKVTFYMLNDYCIHMSLQQPIKKDLLSKIIKT